MQVATYLGGYGCAVFVVCFINFPNSPYIWRGQLMEPVHDGLDFCVMKSTWPLEPSAMLAVPSMQICRRIFLFLNPREGPSALSGRCLC